MKFHKYILMIKKLVTFKYKPIKEDIKISNSHTSQLQIIVQILAGLKARHSELPKRLLGKMLRMLAGRWSNLRTHLTIRWSMR